MRNSEERWVLRLSRTTEKAMRRYPEKDARFIYQVLWTMASDPFTGDIRKLSGWDGAWRRRIGAYRIFYRLDQAQRLVLITKIERRNSKTY